MIREIVERNRSYRRFVESQRISYDFLEGIVDLARLSPSSRNQQAIKFKIVSDQEGCNLLFPTLAWAGYITDWNGPGKGERPAGYIIMLGDKNLGTSFSVDLGISAQSIMLGAVEGGYGGCMIASIQRDKLRKLFSIDENFEILLVLALGKPAEKVFIEDIKDGNIRYWRDENDRHHVPKRLLTDLIV